MTDSRDPNKSFSGVGRISANLSRLIGGSSAIRATARFLRRQMWVWPVLAAALLGGVGWWVYASIERTMHNQMASNLQTVLDADVTALRGWITDNTNNARLVAAEPALLPLVQELLPLAESKEDSERLLVQAKAQKELRDYFKKRVKVLGYIGFFLVSPKGVVLAADQDSPVGNQLTGYRQEFFDKVLQHGASVSKPYRSPLLLADEKGELRANLPTMFAAARVKDGKDIPHAVFGLRIRPEKDFSKILQVARQGESGETYAFDKTGLMLSNSRFDDDLKQMGLLPDLPDASSTLTLELRDPQVNMAEGERPKIRRSEQPLTRMAADAVAGNKGTDVNGYSDYRGVPVIGAWVWLPEYDFGVASEIDVAEAYQPLSIIRGFFMVLMGLLLLSAVVIFVFMLLMVRQQKALQQAVLTARQLGQYALEEKIGSGGMGSVYRARHALLRRPTAVKLLNPDSISDSAIARFEREVQLTGALTHPNTIAIYDYGRTPEGIFYYAMEYLDGVNLDDLVARHGPLPEARVIYILRQVCGSLAEAHAVGLVHRDVKPANIFLTCRGGMVDFVKVLDFGLAKALDTEKEAKLTAANAVTGTPLYLSPEGLQEPNTVDARADVYALGAVGYFLLTGTPVFTGGTLMEICMKQAQAKPETPSSRLGKPVSPALEELLLRCLAKKRDERPAHAGSLLQLLEGCSVSGVWTAAEATGWWQEHSSKSQAPAKSAPPKEDTKNLARTLVYEEKSP